MSDDSFEHLKVPNNLLSWFKVMEENKVSEKPRFKVGDKVRWANPATGSIKMNSIYCYELPNRVTAVDGDMIKTDNTRSYAVTWWEARYFELAPDENSEAYPSIRLSPNDWSRLSLQEKERHLQSLVNKANEGTAAILELDKLAPEQCQIQLAKYTGSKDGWVKLGGITSVFNFRLAPPKPRERKFRLQDWDCVITAENIVAIGCQHFDRKQLHQAIKELADSSDQFVVADLGNNQAKACRRGVNWNGNVLTWENADKLLSELEAFEKESA